MKGSASIISDAHEMCSQKNSTHCFTLKKMYAPVNNQNISTTNVTTSNPIVNTATLKTDNSSNSSSNNQEQSVVSLKYLLITVYLNILHLLSN